MDGWVVYLVECRDSSLYCGITNNLEKRIAIHNKGKGAKYTRSRLPVVLLVVSTCMSMSLALKLEYKVKQQRRDLKIEYLKQSIEGMGINDYSVWNNERGLGIL